MSFEKNLKRLEEIVSQLEGDRLDLNASLGLFEEGIGLLKEASDELNETEAKVKELEGKGMPARAIYTMMKSLSEKHAKTSKNFWN